MITSLSEVNVYYYATMFVSALTSLDIGMFIFSINAVITFLFWQSFPNIVL